MEYLLLIYADESIGQGCEAKAEHPDFETILAEYNAFNEDVQAAGIHRGANPLESIATATTVRVREGKTETVDGPFAETKEQLAGYFLIDCKDQSEAVAWAAKVPGAKWGSIEVRAIKDFSETKLPS